MLEVFGGDSLRHAAGAELISNSNFFRDKIAKYVGGGGPVRNSKNSTQYGSGFGSPVVPPEHAYDWVPDRFAQVGWKYQAHGLKNPYFNHPNKVNSHGYLYGI